MSTPVPIERDFTEIKEALDGDKAFLKKLNELNEKQSKSIGPALEKLVLKHGTNKHLQTNLVWLAKHVRDVTKNLNSLATRLNKIKNTLKKRYPTRIDEIKKGLSFTKDEFNTRQKASSKSLTIALSDCHSVTNKQIKEAVTALKKSYKRTQNDAIILAMLATGRRKLGILRSAVFAKSKKEGHIVIVKTSKVTLGKERKPFDAPLFDLTYDEFVDVLKHARANIPETDMLDNQALTRRFNTRTNRRVKRFFDVGQTHFLRKIYVVRAIAKFKPRKVQESVYVNNILGHLEGQEAVSLHYANVILSDKKLTPDELKAKCAEIKANAKQRDTSRKFANKSTQRSEMFDLLAQLVIIDDAVSSGKFDPKELLREKNIIPLLLPAFIGEDKPIDGVSIISIYKYMKKLKFERLLNALTPP